MSITLDSIRSAADARYGSYDIELTDDTTVKLLNPLRLSKANRDELTAIQAELDVDTDDAEAVAALDQVAVFQRMIRVVAETPKQADALLGAVGDDLAILAEIVRGYSKGTQQGEASASAA
jgi:hypothetical protein